MKQKYTLSIADLQISVISDAPAEEGTTEGSFAETEAETSGCGSAILSVAMLSILSSPAVWIIIDGRKRLVKVETKSHVTNGSDAPTRFTVQFSWIDTIARTA